MSVCVCVYVRLCVCVCVLLVVGRAADVFSSRLAIVLYTAQVVRIVPDEEKVFLTLLQQTPSDSAAADLKLVHTLQYKHMNYST